MNLLKRVSIYSLGLFFMAIGVSISIIINLGVSPVNSLPYVLSLAMGIEQGLLIMLVFTFYVLLQILILGKEFKWINLLQIVFSCIFSYFVTFSNFIFRNITEPSYYIIKLIFLCISIICVSIGLMFYLAADIVPQPAEGIMLAIGKKTGMELSKIKVMFDCFVVVIAVVISLISFGDIKGVREGTILAAIFIGKMLGILNKKYKKIITDFASK